MKCKHEFILEPDKKDLHKAKFTNKELKRTVIRCSKCRKEFPYPIIT